MTMATDDQKGEASDARDRTAASSTEMRFVHERDTTRARKRHEKGTKRAWFGHGFSRPLDAQPPFAPVLAARGKMLFPVPAPAVDGASKTNPYPHSAAARTNPPRTTPPRPGRYHQPQPGLARAQPV